MPRCEHCRATLAGTFCNRCWQRAPRPNSYLLPLRSEPKCDSSIVRLEQDREYRVAEEQDREAKEAETLKRIIELSLQEDLDEKRKKIEAWDKAKCVIVKVKLESSLVTVRVPETGTVADLCDFLEVFCDSPRTGKLVLSWPKVELAEKDPIVAYKNSVVYYRTGEE